MGWKTFPRDGADFHYHVTLLVNSYHNRENSFGNWQQSVQTGATQTLQEITLVTNKHTYKRLVCLCKDSEWAELHNRSFWRRVFPRKHVQWYWQLNSKQIRKNTPEKKPQNIVSACCN